MKLTKIIIKNFKSIRYLELDVKKYGKSYTAMLLWLNESGKSNILEAISCFNIPEKEFNYEEYHNQKDENRNCVDLYYHLEFENKFTYLNLIKEKIINWKMLDFQIENLVKNVWLESSEKELFWNYDFNIIGLGEFFLKKETVQIENGNTKENTKYTLSKTKEDDLYLELTEDYFKEEFSDILISEIKRLEPLVSIWKPTDKYLITNVDLNEFKNNIYSNVPLKNIFAIAGFKKKEQIIRIIDDVPNNNQLRRKLAVTLSEKLTEYVQTIWSHNVKFDIEVSEWMKCTISVLDSGENNKYNFYKMTSRSEGFKHFISLILSLSIEIKELWVHNRIILIDEPELHLHPSGTRDLRDELLRIWETNYIFIATHSPFLVDRDYKERNIIVKKNADAITEIFPIKEERNILDDEVLNIAFGLNPYIDLLLPHKILVEGSTDKIIIEKLLNTQKVQCWITNWCGSNIVQIASRFNEDKVSVLVIVDWDQDGRLYRKNILKIKWVYNEANVFTIKELLWNIKDDATIEDILWKEYVEGKLKQFIQEKYNIEKNVKLEDSQPFVKQVKKYLQSLDNELSKDVMDEFKQLVSDDFSPTKSSIQKNSLQIDFVNSIKDKLF